MADEEALTATQAGGGGRVCGILSVVLAGAGCCLPIFGFFLIIPALVLGILAVCLKGKKTMGIVGIVLSLVVVPVQVVLLSALALLGAGIAVNAAGVAVETMGSGIHVDVEGGPKIDIGLQDGINVDVRKQ